LPYGNYDKPEFGQPQEEISKSEREIIVCLTANECAERAYFLCQYDHFTLYDCVWKHAQERVERRSRKRSSIAGSEKIV